MHYDHLVIVWQDDLDQARVYVNGDLIGNMGLWSDVGTPSLEGGHGISEFRIQGGSSDGTGDKAYIDEVYLYTAD